MNGKTNKEDSDQESSKGADDRGGDPVTAIAVGTRLRAARKALGHTQQALAAIAGVKLPTQKDYERGKSVPGGEALAGFARARINIHWLLGDDHAPMLLETAEKALRTADLVRAWQGDSEAQERVEHLEREQLSRLARARDLVEGIVSDVGFMPGSAVMGSLIMSVCLHGVKEEAVRDLVKAMMAQAALDARSRT